MRREGRHPVDSEVSYPNNEDRDVDGEDPDHENEDRMRVVVEVVVCVKVLLRSARFKSKGRMNTHRFAGQFETANTSYDLHNTEHDIRKLVRNHRRHQ